MEQNDKSTRECIKIVLFGPESTGKTTLSKQLAKHYNTVCVPEFARDYLQKKWNESQQICELSDIVPIARGQIESENELLSKANKLLICDTDVLETKVYSQVFYNETPKELDTIIKDRFYDLHLLTYIDTPWVPDDLRDRPNKREEMFTSFEKALQQYKKKYILLRGSKKTRLKTAVAAIDQILKKTY